MVIQIIWPRNLLFSYKYQPNRRI